MNVLTYNPDALTKRTVIPLGRACECRATRVEFMVADWLARFPGGEIALYIKDPNGELYLADVRTADGVASWVLRESDTRVPGYGVLELALIGANGEKKLSSVATTKLETSLVDSETDAEYMQPWIERAAEIQAETETAAKAAATHAAIASTSASNAVEAENAAENAEEAAEDAAQAAEESAQAAGAAAEVVAAHTQEAADSAQGAAAAEDAAAESAQEAADSASEAAAEAEMARNARDSAQEAANAADNHAQAAKAAATHAAAIVGPVASGIVVETSGDVVSITDAAARLAMAVVSVISPTTAGVSAASVTRRGRNLFDVNNYTAKDIFLNPGKIGSTKNRSVVIPIKPGTTYTAKKGVSTIMRLGTCVETPAIGVNVTVYEAHTEANTDPLTITSGPSDRWLVVQLLTDGDAANGASVTKIAPSLMVEEGRTASPYEPCQGVMLTANLPAPCYGGRLDWMTGVLTVTHDATGAELAEPTTQQVADAQQLTMLSGYNAMWSDTGGTELAYIADTKLYIDNKVAEIAASILNV